MGLHLQLLTTTFVRWGRTGTGTFEDGPLTDRAVTWMDMEDGTLPLEIPFTLPEGAQEHGRRRMTGWRFRTNNLIHDTGWRLAESPEAALEAARAYALTTEKVSGNRILLEAMEDVRAAVEWPPRTVETEKFRVTVTGTVARWERRTIAKGGKRLTWKRSTTSRWDETQGFWGGTPHDLSYPELSALELAIRNQAK